MTQSFIKIISVLFAITVLMGCASKGPSFGDSVQAEGKAVASIGKKWEKGQAMIKKGNKLVRKGNKQVANGEENIADGNAMTKTGKKLVEEAEKAYEALNASAPAQ